MKIRWIPVPVNLTESGTEGAEEDGVSSDKVVPEVRAVEEKLAEMQDKYIGFQLNLTIQEKNSA